MKMSPSQPLPAKENGLFKKILKCYEMKQYKNGLKFAKIILTNPKFCDHGETLAMKGLTLNCLGRKDEAYDYVRKGLKNDLRSHVCWHVYGLLQRSDHKYDEAIKAYRNALRWDKDNIQILRDLSLLQIQMRDLEGYRDTRHQLFMLRPTQKVSWIGYAMAYHLLTDYETAVKILEEFRKTTQAQKPAHSSGQKGHVEQIEQSELLLYQAQVYKEAGMYQEALDHLHKHEKTDICDKLAVHEMRIQLLMLVGRNDEAAKIIRNKLIARNPNNIGYYKQLEQATGVANAKEESKLRHYSEFQDLYPRSQMPFRIPLGFVSNLNKFKELVDAYLRKSLKKGQPALFRDFKTLYLAACGSPLTVKWSLKRNVLPNKIQMIQDLLRSYQYNLKTYESFDVADSTWGSEDTTCILWVNYFLAQHYDFLGDYETALAFVNEALDHTPTLIELYVVKAKIYKHAGNIEEGVVCMEEAQSLDTADRYLNSKCAKYLLRANRISDSEEMCSKFTREGVSASENLNEMQCMWYQTESALAYQRLENYGESMKKCVEIDRHFSEITEDQFDFHTYCMRKMTLRAYVGLLRLEDGLKQHPFYFVAAKLAIDVYLRLYDKPLSSSDEAQNVAESNLTQAELKKLRNKQKRADQREKAMVKQKEEEARARHDKEHDKENPSSEPAIEKLDPKKLERPENALTEAIKFLTPLQMLANKRIETHLLAFEIFYRKGKIMLMLQSLKRAVRIDPTNATLHRQLVLFYDLTETQKEQFAAPLKQVLDLELKKLAGEKITSASALGDHYLKQNSNSFVHRYESAKLMAMLNKDNFEAKRNAVNLLCSQELDTLEDVSLEGCSQMIASIKSGLFGEVEESVVEELKRLCRNVYPLATLFMLASDRKLLKDTTGEDIERYLAETSQLSPNDQSGTINHVSSLPGDTIIRNDNYVL